MTTTLRVLTADGSTLELRELEGNERTTCSLCETREADVAVVLERRSPHSIVRQGLGNICGAEIAAALAVRYGAVHVQAGGRLEDLTEQVAEQLHGDATVPAGPVHRHDVEPPQCTCTPVRVGTLPDPVGLNWNPDCPVHTEHPA